MEKLKSCSFYFVAKFLTKKYFLFLFISVAFIANGFFVSTAFASTTIDTDITENTTWMIDESPYLIKNAIHIEEGVTLTIEPGVVVKFKAGEYPYSGTSLDISGTIIAEGTENNPIYFTSIYDDELGGSTDDYESCGYEVDENGDPFGEETCETYDYANPYPGDWRGIYLTSSAGSSFKNVFFRYANDALYFKSSSINFENLNINDSYSGLTGDLDSNIEILGGNFDNLEDAFTFYDNSSLQVQNISVTNVENGFTGYNSSDYLDNHESSEFFNNSSLTITDSIINSKDYGVSVFNKYSLMIINSSVNSENDGIEIFNDSSATITDSPITCWNNGIEIFNNSSLNLSGGTISCFNNGIVLFNGIIASIDGVKITDSLDAGITAFTNAEPNQITVTNSEITGNEYGFEIFDSTFSAYQNSIHDNFTSGVDTFTDILLDFTSNYWGDKTGPTHSSNPTGLGDIVSDNILFEPFLKFDPLKPGVSNVMLIPGFEASRMYKTKSYLGSEIEDKLWESNAGDDIRDLFMDENGVSIDSDIYTRDIVGTATLFGIGVKNFYKSFMDQMDELVAKDEIAGWKAIAYDWRLSPTDIVNRGIEKENGNISYNEELTEDQIPYIINQLQKLADSSKNGKVTIVVHSNGGLVAKALVFKLEEMKKNGESDLVDYIDNIIFVGSPLLGTPEAIPALLHGYNQGKLLNLLLSRKNARDFGQNLPGAYNLLPSEKYMDEIDNNLITLDESLDKLNNWKELYGQSVDTFEELEKFLSASDGNRMQPNYNDLVNPLILNETLFDRAKLFHDNLDDLVFPETIKIHQVSGWGIPTTYDLKYKSKNECDIFLLVCIKKKLALSSDVGLVSGGDGTVIADTALAGDGIDYYLNLGEYNKDNKFSLKKSHANIFDVPFLFDLVHNIIKGDSSLPEYVTTTQPSPVDFTVIKMHSPVAIDIYNEDGLHTGMVENDDPDLEFIEENIPNSSYLEVGDEKYLIVPRDENYRLELTGLSDGIFTLEQELVVNDLPVDSVVFRDISTTSSLRGEVDINADSLATSISLDKEGDGIFESVIYPSTGEEDENIGSGKHYSSGSIPLVINKISEAKVDILNNKDVINSNIREISLEKIKYDLPEDTKSNKNKEITKSEPDNYNPNISASAGDSGIISKRTAISGIVASLILLIGFKLIFRIKI
ncbi:MAG: hypothetical protein WC908_03270 [Candidatus Paceibacterota bacterium]